MKYSQLLLLIGFLVLSGCQTPNIIEEYNEFKGEKTCRLHRYLINTENVVQANRDTLISLTRDDALTVKVTLETVVQRNFTSLSNNARLEFMLTNHDHTNETLTFTGSDHQVAHGSIAVQSSVGGYYVTSYVPTITTSLNFFMTLKQLQKIATSRQIDIMFEASYEPIKAVLKQESLDAFKLFMGKCYKN